MKVSRTMEAWRSEYLLKYSFIKIIKKYVVQTENSVQSLQTIKLKIYNKQTSNQYISTTCHSSNSTKFNKIQHNNTSYNRRKMNVTNISINLHCYPTDVLERARYKEKKSGTPARNKQRKFYLNLNLIRDFKCLIILLF